MPIDYRVDHALRRVVARGLGLLTDADFVSYQRELWSQPGVTGYDEIVDMRDVTDIEDVSSERIFELANLSASMDDRNSRSRFAIVAPSDLHFGLARMYGSYRNLHATGTKQVNVFRSMEEAECWLVR
jgi:hypothetical protein